MVSRTQPSGPLCLWQCFLSTSPRTGFHNLKLKHQLRYRSNTICRTLMFLMELGQRCQKREHRQIIYNWCLKRARCRKYSTINFSKIFTASSCSRRLSRNQITGKLTLTYILSLHILGLGRKNCLRYKRSCILSQRCFTNKNLLTLLLGVWATIQLLT